MAKAMTVLSRGKGYAVVDTYTGETYGEFNGKRAAHAFVASNDGAPQVMPAKSEAQHKARKGDLVVFESEGRTSYAVGSKESRDHANDAPRKTYRVGVVTATDRQGNVKRYSYGTGGGKGSPVETYHGRALTVPQGNLTDVGAALDLLRQNAHLYESADQIKAALKPFRAAEAAPAQPKAAAKPAALPSKAEYEARAQAHRAILPPPEQVSEMFKQFGHDNVKTAPLSDLKLAVQLLHDRGQRANTKGRSEVAESLAYLRKELHAEAAFRKSQGDMFAAPAAKPAAPAAAKAAPVAAKAVEKVVPQTSADTLAEMAKAVRTQQKEGAVFGPEHAKKLDAIANEIMQGVTGSRRDPAARRLDDAAMGLARISKQIKTHGPVWQTNLEASALEHAAEVLKSKPEAAKAAPAAPAKAAAPKPEAFRIEEASGTRTVKQGRRRVTETVPTYRVMREVNGVYEFTVPTTYRGEAEVWAKQLSEGHKPTAAEFTKTTDAEIPYRPGGHWDKARQAAALKPVSSGLHGTQNPAQGMQRGRKESAEAKAARQAKFPTVISKLSPVVGQHLAAIKAAKSDAEMRAAAQSAVQSLPHSELSQLKQNLSGRADDFVYEAGKALKAKASPPSSGDLTGPSKETAGQVKQTSGLHGTQNPNNLNAIVEGKKSRAKPKAEKAAKAEPAYISPEALTERTSMELPKPAAPAPKQEAPKADKVNLEKLAEQYRATGRIAVIYKSKNVVSIDGRSMPNAEAIKKMQSVIAAAPADSALRSRIEALAKTNPEVAKAVEAVTTEPKAKAAKAPKAPKAPKVAKAPKAAKTAAAPKPESSGLRGTQNKTNLEAIVANKQAAAAPKVEAAPAKPKRYVSLGDGRKMPLDKYTEAWKKAKALDPSTPVRGTPSDPIGGGTAGDVARELHEGMQNRINKADPAYGKGRKWDASWQADARRLKDTLATRSEVPAGQAHPVDLRAKIAHRLAEGTVIPPPGGSKAPAKPIKLAPPPVAAKPKVPQVAPMRGMAPLGMAKAAPAPVTAKPAAPTVPAPVAAAKPVEAAPKPSRKGKALGVLAVAGVGAAMLAAANKAKAEGLGAADQAKAAGVEGAKGGAEMAAWTGGVTAATAGLVKAGLTAAKAFPLVNAGMIAGGAIHGAVTAKPGERLAGAAKGAWDMSLPGMVVNTGLAAKDAIQGRMATPGPSHAPAPATFAAAQERFSAMRTAAAATEAGDKKKGWSNAARIAAYQHRHPGGTALPYGGATDPAKPIKG